MGMVEEKGDKSGVKSLNVALDVIEAVANAEEEIGVTEIARTVCELLEWTRPGGGLKNHECRQLLERLQAEGFLKLPELRHLGGRGPRRADASGTCSEPAPVTRAASECAERGAAHAEFHQQKNHGDEDSGACGASAVERKRRQGVA